MHDDEKLVTYLAADSRSNKASSTKLPKLDDKRIKTTKDSDSSKTKLPMSKNIDKSFAFKEIKHRKTKSLNINEMLQEVDYRGPYYSKCNHCRDKNLNFYETMSPNNAERIIQYIKKTTSVS